MWTGIGSIINNTKFPNNSSKILDRSNKYNINVISVSYDETLKQERISTPYSVYKRSDNLTQAEYIYIIYHQIRRSVCNNKKNQK